MKRGEINGTFTKPEYSLSNGIRCMGMDNVIRVFHEYYDLYCVSIGYGLGVFEDMCVSLFYLIEPRTHFYSVKKPHQRISMQ